MQIPRKVRDLLPEETAARKKVLTKIIKVFEKYNYQEIITPTFENFDILNQGLPESLIRCSYRFFDHNGWPMILRPDVTTQIARMAATTLKDQTGPMRFYYSGDVYRAKELEIGQHYQFHQIGIELFDANEKTGDAEILKIANAALKAIGLTNFSIEKTDVRNIQKLTKSEKEALRKQDFVKLGRLPEKSELMAVDIDYYTGLYFECYVPELGYIIGSGGRYDNLTGKFGQERSAVGFAFNLDKLMLALAAQKKGQL